jgi:hypothetical protein
MMSIRAKSSLGTATCLGCGRLGLGHEVVLGVWPSLVARKDWSRAAVGVLIALANKAPRLVWAIMVRGGVYRRPASAAAMAPV